MTYEYDRWSFLAGLGRLSNSPFRCFFVPLLLGRRNNYIILYSVSCCCVLQTMIRVRWRQMNQTSRRPTRGHASSVSFVGSCCLRATSPSCWSASMPRVRPALPPSCRSRLIPTLLKTWSNARRVMSSATHRTSLKTSSLLSSRVTLRLKRKLLTCDARVAPTICLRSVTAWTALSSSVTRVLRFVC